MKHTIDVNKTAVYHSIGNISTAKTIWFVLHGYGYAAEHFIKKFEPILDEDTVIIAPEGLSRFYIQGVEGRIGASWMTSSDRENEIKDYVNYLNQLYESIIDINKTNDVKINVLGFSQGGATASRWVANGKVNVANFILWASVFPDDMNFDTIANINTFFIYGDNDKYVTSERVLKQKEIFSQANTSIKTVLFKGKHDIPAEVLTEQLSINNW